MFNKKLKEKIKELEIKIVELEEQNAFECECVSERDKIIEAQGLLLTYFSSYIVANDVKNKKVQTKTIKIKIKNKKGKK